MKAALRHIEEINRLKAAIEKTESKHLKKDYLKNVRRLQKELKTYCRYRGFTYKEIMNK